MIEIRQVVSPDGTRWLEYRQRRYRTNAWGDLMSGYDPWEAWEIVQEVSLAQVHAEQAPGRAQQSTPQTGAE
jgi:hypothetical protein